MCIIRKQNPLSTPFFVPLLLLFLLCSPFPADAESLDQLSQKLTEQIDANRLLSFREQQVETSLARDAIPPINYPRFISTEDATLSNDPRDIAFVAEFGSEVRIYPRLILVWHEIVNDRLQGKPISITYCPLTGSVVGYKGSLGKYELTFGTTGFLLFNNRILYDRSTNSHWPQLLGVAVEGPLHARKLKTFPLIWTTIGQAVKKFPEAKILSRDTGYRRSYGRDPYGSYRRGGTYYQNSLVAHYIPHLDKRLPLKEPVIGIPGSGSSAAIRKGKMRELRVLNLSAGLEELVAFYDPSLGAVRVFDRTLKRRTLDFEFAQGRIMDKQSGSEWSPKGNAVAGTFYGEQLQRVPSFDSMWFGWSSFFPGGEIYPDKNAGSF